MTTAKSKAASRTKADRGAFLSQVRNAQVRTLRPHSNSYGRAFQKKKGDTYSHPRPHADILAGLVELVEGTTGTKA